MPKRAEMWDFLVGLKEITEMGFQRVDSQLKDLHSRVDRFEQNITRRLVHIDDRLSAIEGLNVRETLADHELRIGKLEGKRA